MKKALSLYLHFPFCVRKCRYCDFLSFPAGQKERQEYVDLLCREIRQRGPAFADYEVRTVFFGGGTPSLMEPGQLGLLMEAIYDSFAVLKDAEISLECNPGTADQEKLAAYRALRINRLSIGLQSADDDGVGYIGVHHFVLDIFHGIADIGGVVVVGHRAMTLAGLHHFDAGTDVTHLPVPPCGKVFYLCILSLCNHPVGLDEIRLVGTFGLWYLDNGNVIVTRCQKNEE